VGTLNPASQLPTKSWVFFGFPIQNRNLELEVYVQPQNPRGESGPAVDERQMSDFPCGKKFSRAHTSRATSQTMGKSTVSHTNAHFWRQTGALGLLPVMSHKTRGCRWVPPCGRAPPTPRLAGSKWKLLILQADYRPKVGFFWVFPYKTGIESRRSMTVHRNHMGKVVRQFLCVQ
jgi:hypothetical protein